jgi:hypothetical protein
MLMLGAAAAVRWANLRANLMQISQHFIGGNPVHIEQQQSAMWEYNCATFMCSLLIKLK